MCGHTRAGKKKRVWKRSASKSSVTLLTARTSLLAIIICWNTWNAILRVSGLLQMMNCRRLCPLGYPNNHPNSSKTGCENSFRGGSVVLLRMVITPKFKNETYCKSTVFSNKKKKIIALALFVPEMSGRRGYLLNYLCNKIFDTSFVIKKLC